MFSPDGDYLAWTCGYGLVKLLKWNQTRKRTLSSFNEQQTSPVKSSKLDQDDSVTSTPQAINLTDSVLLTPPSLDNSPQQVNSSDHNELNLDEIVEIDCGELVGSLAFGSTSSYCKHRRNVHKQSRVNTRFDFEKHNLILAIGLYSGKIRIYNGTTGTFLLYLFDHQDCLNDLKFTKDGSLQLASVSNDQTIKLWNLYDDGNMYKTLQGHVGKVLSCDWSPTHQLLVSVGVNRQAYIWDTDKFSVKHTLKGHLNDVVTCQFSPDGCLCATGSYDTKICLWDPYTGALIRNFYHVLPPPRFIYASGFNDAFIRSLSFCKGGDHLVSICDDKKLRIWSLTNRSAHPLAETTQFKGICCAYSSDNRLIMVGTKLGYVDVYEAPVVIQRLVDLCRKVVNQYVDHEKINKLALPNELKRFLQYDDIRDHPVSSTNSSTNTANSNNTSRSHLQAYQHSTVTLCN